MLITSQSFGPSKDVWIADRRIYLNALGEVVEAGDPSKLTLLVAQGCGLPMSEAVRLGLARPIETKAAMESKDSKAARKTSKK